MAEKKEVVGKYVAKGIKVDIACNYAGISKSTYYYKHKTGHPGRKPSSYSFTKTGGIIPDTMTVKMIKAICQEDFTEYGYIKMTWELKDRGLIINKKKVLRLMKENQLLFKKNKSSKKEFVKFYQPLPLMPFDCLEMDIKFIYIKGQHKNALLITVLDTFSRVALEWDLQYSIKHDAVIYLLKNVIRNWLQIYKPYFDETPVSIRSDNDSRFIANDLKKFLILNDISQQFIMPATPQQNAHIESFHSVVEQLVCSKLEFENIEDARLNIEKFMDTYNNRRTISSIAYLPPMVFLKECLENNISLIYSKKGNRFKHKFIFKERRPDWCPALSEDFLNG